MTKEENGIFRRYLTARKGQAINHCCIYGVFCAAMNIPLADALSHYLYAQTSAIVTNCVKTIPLSQSAFNVYAIQKAAEIYAQDHEGFKVEVSEVQSDDIETRLTTAVSAGDLSTLPDIFLMQDNSFQKYATNYPDIFTDLTDSGIDFGEFSSAKVAYSTLDGKNYGIPFDTVCFVIDQ